MGAANARRFAVSPHRWAQLNFVVPTVAACIPPVLVGTLVARHGVDVPFWDEWSLVPLVAAFVEGRVRLDDLWALHNEHRILLPRMALLLLARATAWNMRAEMAVNVLLSIVLLAVLGLLVRRTVATLAPTLAPWLVLGASLFTFSLSGWEAWLWGFGMPILLSVVFAASAALSLAAFGAGWQGSTLATVSSIAAACCFGSGLALLAILPIGLWFTARWAPVKGTLLGPTVALIVGLGFTAIYMNGFTHPTHHPSYTTAFGDLPTYAYYVVIFLGAGRAPWSARIAAAWGVLGIIIASCSAIVAARRSRAHRAALAPWLMLSLFGLLTAAVIGVGRVGFGAGQALASRYVPLSSVFWTSTMAMGALAATPASKRPHRIAGSASVVVLLLLVISSRRSDQFSRRRIHAHEDALRKGRACVIDPENAPDTCLGLLYANPDTVRSGAERLRVLGLGPAVRPR